jgi:ABC-type glycerol-3-phosphate transport system permease component
MSVLSRESQFVVGRALRVPLGGELAILVLLLAMLVFFVYPALWIFIASFKTPDSMFAGGAGVFTIDNYVRLFHSEFAHAMFNSFVVCAGSVIVSTLVSVGAAYSFSRMEFPGRRMLFRLMLLGQTFPWIVLVTPLFMVFARAGLLDSRFGLAAAYVAICIPFSVYLLVGYLQGIPRSLDEAALMDGASQFQILWKVIFPVMVPGVIATATHAFLVCWGEYLFALAFLSDDAVKTMPLLLQNFFGDSVPDWGLVMAASVVATLPTLILFAPVQGRIVGGLGGGAVK